VSQIITEIVASDSVGSEVLVACPMTEGSGMWSLRSIFDGKNTSTSTPSHLAKLIKLSE
jgi:hypothetical protein